MNTNDFSHTKTHRISVLKILAGVCLLAAGVYAVAAPIPLRPSPTDGMQQAEKVCQSMGFPNEVLRCVKLISAAKYFDARAVGVCSERSFPSEKQVCLETIRDLEFTQTSLDTCISLPFSSKLVECLKSSGRPSAIITALKKEEKESAADPQIEGEIRRAIRQLDAGNSRRARMILRGVLGEIESKAGSSATEAKSLAY